MARSRGALVNLATNEMHEFLFMPDQLSGRVGVNYNRHTPIAASRQHLHYASTNNAVFSFELIGHKQLIARRLRGADGRLPTNLFAEVEKRFNDMQQFLLSLCYPRGSANDPIRRSPPRALFVWPGAVALDIVVLECAINYRKFDAQSKPMYFVASLQLEEIRDYRLTSAMVRRSGWNRGTGQSRSTGLSRPKGTRS